MADSPAAPDSGGSSRGAHIWVPIVSALIIAVAAIVAAVIQPGPLGGSSTTTVVETVFTPPPEGEAGPPAGTTTEAGEETTPCIASPAAGDAGDNSIGTPRGPLESGRTYRGTLIKGDEEWWGFCAAGPGRVDIRVENVCDDQGTGATNMLAEVLAPSGEEIEKFRVDPGRFVSVPIQVEASVAYYIHIFDLYDVDVGNDICGEVPWTLAVTGDLTAEVPDP